MRLTELQCRLLRESLSKSQEVLTEVKQQNLTRAGVKWMKTLKEGVQFIEAALIKVRV